MIWETSSPSRKSILFKKISSDHKRHLKFKAKGRQFTKKNLNQDQLVLIGGQKYYNCHFIVVTARIFVHWFSWLKCFDSLNFHKWKNYGSLDVESAVGMLNGSGIPEWSDQMVNFWWLLRVFPKRGGRGKIQNLEWLINVKFSCDNYFS